MVILVRKKLTQTKGKTRFFKYKSLRNFEFILDIILKERLYAASYYELNDPMEGVIKVDSTIPKERESEWESFIEELRITCFTKDKENLLMWSHYGDGGKGCLIEFELLDGQKYHKVSYLKKPTINNLNFNAEKAFEILQHKDKPWKYEAEYRCIQKNENFLPVNIKSIAFGPRANEDSVTMLIHIFSLCKPNLKIKKMSNLRVFDNIGSLSGGVSMCYVRKTSDPDACLKCASVELTQKQYVGAHRGWKDYE